MTIAAHSVASPTAGQAARSVTCKKNHGGRGVQQGLFLEFRLDQLQAHAHDEHDPGDGRQGVDPDGPGPALQPHRAGIGQGIPALQSEAGLPGGRLQVERHQEHEAQEDAARAAARHIGTHQQPGPQRSQRHGQRQTAPQSSKLFSTRPQVR